MSAITPPSFLDDGVSITNRLPQGLDAQRVAKWVSRSSFSDTSVYTGSFFDDNEDMVARGGGISDRQLGYEKGEKKEKHSSEGMWNENAKRAVSGDVRRHVDKIRELREKVHVRKVMGIGGMDKKKEKVTVPVPRQWGTFVIKDKDGRVVVVDEEGEFDSGPPQETHNVKQHERRWVRAASTVEPPSPSPVPPSTLLPPRDQQTGASRLTEHIETAQRGHEKDEWDVIQGFARPLTPILESEDEDGPSSASGEPMRSPTGFMAAVTNWKDHSQTSTTGNSHKSSGSIDEDRGWVSPSKLPHPFTWTNSPSDSHRKWNCEPKDTDDAEWTDSEASSLQKDVLSEASWDGFERRKTLSDVSIAGSNSVHSSLQESRRTIHHDTAMSRRRGTSRKQIRVDNQHGWEHGSSERSKAKYANSSDEDNATYQNANGGETPARVAKY